MFCFFVSREKYLFKNRTNEVPPNSYYHSLYPKIIQDIEVSIHPVTHSCIQWSVYPSAIKLRSHPSTQHHSLIRSPIFSFCLSRLLRRTGVVGVTIFSGFSAGQRTVKVFIASSTMTTRSSAAYGTTPLKYLSVCLSICMSVVIVVTLCACQFVYLCTIPCCAALFNVNSVFSLKIPKICAPQIPR